MYHGVCSEFAYHSNKWQKLCGFMSFLLCLQLFKRNSPKFVQPSRDPAKRYSRYARRESLPFTSTSVLRRNNLEVLIQGYCDQGRVSCSHNWLDSWLTVALPQASISILRVHAHIEGVGLLTTPLQTYWQSNTHLVQRKPS